MLTSIIEIRKKIIEGYGKYEYIINPLFKFVLSFLLIRTINAHIGFALGLTNQLLGVIIALVSIPISMGYAQIAGLPAVCGLYGSIFPILMRARLG